MHPRVIVSLFLLGEKLFKTKLFKPYKYLGDPLNAIRIYNSKMVDEVALSSSHDERLSKLDSSRLKFLETIASEAFCPLSYSGLIRTLDDCKNILNCGFEKIGFRTLIYEDIKIIRDFSSKFGSQSTIAYLDYKIKNKKYLLFNAKNKKNPLELEKKELILFAKKLENQGVGEIVFQSIDRDCSSKGLDVDLAESLKGEIGIPIILSGGLNSLNDAKKAFIYGADAVMGSKFFTLIGNKDGALITYPTYQEISALKK
tara:strand:+ start:1351 stop:2121 length:771 start_codon:yes stop_codon:yes gene_type:complete